MVSDEKKLHHHEPWPEGSRPQDRSMTGRHLTIEPVEPCRGLPRRVRVTDFQGNTCVYVPVMKVIKHPPSRGPVTFSVNVWGGDVEDDMPQTVDAVDAEANYCIYEAVNPRLMC